MTSPKRIKKVMLIHPPCTILKRKYKFFSPPLGILYLAAVLENAGFEVSILDAALEGAGIDTAVDEIRYRYGLPIDAIIERVVRCSPDAVGISCVVSSQYPICAEITSKIRSCLPGATILLGGEHPSALPEKALSETDADFIVIGEGERTLCTLLAELAGGGDVGGIDGLAFRNHSRIRINPKTHFVQDIDSIPFPARHLVNMQAYFDLNLPQGTTSRRTPNTPLITSRGCTARCCFCATTRFWGNRFRPRSPENVVEELQTLIDTYGIREVQFLDDNLTLDKRRAMQLFDLMIARGLDLAWCTPQGLAVWSLDDELIEKMAASGCYEVTLAIESGSQRVLNEIVRKPLNLARVSPLVKRLKAHGMVVHSFFIVGLPGETKTEIKQTFAFARACGVDTASFFAATPLPGTELYHTCNDNGYLRPGFNVCDIDYNRGNIFTPDFEPEYIERQIARHSLLFNAGLAIRNPRAFCSKLLRLIATKPLLMVNLTLSFVRSFFKAMFRQDTPQTRDATMAPANRDKKST